MAQPQPDVIPIAVDPPHPMETKEVLMIPPIPSDKIKFCTWYRQQKGGEMEEITTVYPKGGENIPGEGLDERIMVYSNCTLHIKELTKDDSADYVLVEGGLLVITLFLLSADFLPKPNVTAKPSNAIEELHPVHFFCNAPNDLMITWFKDRELYTNESHLLDNNKTLLIPSVTKNDTGGYQCQITNHTSMKTDQVTLNQLPSAVLNITINHPPEAIEGKLISLHCMSRGDNVSYSWTKGGQVVRADGRISLKNNNQTLELNPGYRNDTADYICHGNNSISSNQSEPYHLDIIYGPEHPVISPLQQVYNEHSILNLVCSAVSNPPAKFSWYLNGELLEHQNDSHLTQRLTLKNAGNYTCKVTNVESGLSKATVLEISIRGE
uniref:Ig-like domain-containing protein n=1 Tax=Pseudonaja textilis TaxID=8673 RepID=A0A670ZXZ4_PSETE